MTERERVKSILDNLKLLPKRSLGQNFLCDETALNALVADFPEGVTAALEVGPGLGSLTARIFDKVDEVVAIEIDQRFLDVLRKRFAARDFTLHHGDILKFPLNSLDLDFSETLLFGNLPYYITTECVELFAVALGDMPEQRLLMQKEALERLLEPPKGRGYGPINVLLDLCYTATKGPIVTSHAFYPPPRITSQLLILKEKGEETLLVEALLTPDEAALLPPELREQDPELLLETLNNAVARGDFLKFLKELFAHRRKSLRKGLRASSYDYPHALEHDFYRLRAEALPPRVLLQLFTLLA